MGALKITRQDGESWRDCALRYGRKYGLEAEVAESFWTAIRGGMSEENAAFEAVMDWDCCDLERE